jgi:hypothetical protein
MTTMLHLLLYGSEIQAIEEDNYKKECILIGLNEKYKYMEVFLTQNLHFLLTIQISEMALNTKETEGYAIIAA